MVGLRTIRTSLGGYEDEYEADDDEGVHDGVEPVEEVAGPVPERQGEHLDHLVHDPQRQPHEVNYLYKGAGSGSREDRGR